MTASARQPIRTSDISAFLEDVGPPQPPAALPHAALHFYRHIVEHNIVQGVPGFMHSRHGRELFEAAELQTGVITTARAAASPADQTAYRYPRGIPWTMFPVIDGPYYSFRRVARRGAHFLPDDPGKYPESIDLEHAIAVARTIIVHLQDGLQPIYRARHLAAAIHILKQTDRRHGLYAYQAGKAFPVDIEQLEDLAAGITPLERFLYVYAVNMRAIAGRALREVVTSRPLPLSSFEDPDVREWEQDAHRRSLELLLSFINTGQVQLFTHPEALQLLYRLRRQTLLLPTGKPAEAAFLVDHNDDRLEAPVYWRGTGRHPDTYVGLRHEFLGCLGLDRLGLVESHPDGYSLSEAGHQFLSMLHPKCVDPDMIGRWQHRDLRGQEAAIDAQLEKFFRRMKTRINATIDDFDT